MYPTVKVACPICGDAILTIAELHVYVYDLDCEGHYEFKCPICHDTVSRKAQAHILKLLINSGVMYDLLPVSLELLEQRGSGDPITHEELLEFHELIQDDNALAYFLGGD